MTAQPSTPAIPGRTRRDGDQDPSFGPLLEREVLGTYLLRARVLAALFGAGLLVAFLTRYTPGQPPQYSFGSGPSRIVIGSTAFLAAYEAAVALWIARRRERGAAPASWIWYLGATVELTVPTLAIWMMAARLDAPAFALATPVVLVYFGFIALSTLRLSARFSLFSGALAAVEYAVLSILLLRRYPLGPEVDPLFSSLHFPIQRSVILLAVGVGCAFVATELRRRVAGSVLAWRESQRILRVFGRQTSPEVAQALLEGEGTAREHRFVCVLFLDMRNFSAFAESREPSEVVAYLDAFFEFAIAAVVQHHGHVHQLLGDGFMAIFGAPQSGGNDCANAVAAAVEIMRRLDEA
ncbi:MAG: adenylate/guanylate cyclase domain-containing protein, partial [Gemmatimonadetes bacterium]|nr:adenylate/guanylate cyclase domain-containing protein [Gemmatimonadota bacterium]